MTSNKQKRERIKARREKRAARAAATQSARPGRMPPLDTLPVDTSALAPYNSYGEPAYARRGYYEDVPFTCVDCGVEEVWTPAQQKWWYEVAKGYPYSSANRCRECRRARRDRSAESRRVHLEGLARKSGKLPIHE